MGFKVIWFYIIILLFIYYPFIYMGWFFILLFGFFMFGVGWYFVILLYVGYWDLVL